MDTITITIAENDPDVIVSATLNEDAVTITLNESAVGPAGAAGVGVPTGGAANDILKKTSSTDYATAWETPTSAATANTVVRRDASGGAAFVALTGTGNWSTTGHFFSNPGTSEAGHFLTKNGTTPTLAAGRSAWFSSTTGSPQFKNGTGEAVTLIYDGSALGTPASGTLTNCTGLPVSTGISGFGANVATFLATPSSANLIAAVTDATGDGEIVTNANPTIYDIYLQESVNFNAESYTYGAGSAALHRAALGLTALATTTPGTGVATLLTGTPSGTGGPVGTTSPTITTPTMTRSGNGTIFTASEGTRSFTFGAQSYGTEMVLAASTVGQGAYVTANGMLESWVNVIANSNTTNFRVMRFGNKNNRFEIQRLNDASNSILGTPFSLANNAPDYAFYMLTSGTVGFGTSTPSEKALLDLTSTTKGFLPPRMTTVQRDAITSVPAGLMIYNTTTNKLNVYTTAWEAVTSA